MGSTPSVKPTKSIIFSSSWQLPYNLQGTQKEWSASIICNPKLVNEYKSVLYMENNVYIYELGAHI